MRVLVTGGRDFDDRKVFHAFMATLFVDRHLDTIIHGACGGADRMADTWARMWHLNIERYPANWSKYGRKAGPMRNEQMLREGKPNLVVAFPGGRGTADMVRRARKAGVEVVEVAP